MRSPSRILVGCIALLGMSLTAQSAKAGYLFNDGNVNFPGGAPYAELNITANAGTGTIVMDLSPVNDPTALFGSLGFNLGGGLTFADLQQATITVTGTGANSANASQWTLQSGGQMDGHGTFDAIIAPGNNGASASERLNTVTITIQLLLEDWSKAVVANVAQPNEDTPPKFFAAHYYPSDGSQTGFIASDGDFDEGVDVVPAPAGILLLASAIPVLGLRRLLRRKTA